MKITDDILSIEQLSITFTQYTAGWNQTTLPVIKDLSLRVAPGEMVAVVGSSGSGKSLLAHAILGILPYNASVGGRIFYQQEVLTDKKKELLRGKEIVLVPQSVEYLDPLIKVGNQIRKGKQDLSSKTTSRQVLERYGLGAEVEQLYPFELSGGMARRILIATAVTKIPKLVIADEPTPGLHLDAAKRVLSHFREIADQGAGVLLITHDLELALCVADRVVVFYAGTNVEDAAVGDFCQEDQLRHPYSKALFRAMPRNGFLSTPGTQPYAKSMPCGCPYRPRCSNGSEECDGDIPYRFLRNGMVRCGKAR